MLYELKFGRIGVGIAASNYPGSLVTRSGMSLVEPGEKCRSTFREWRHLIAYGPKEVISG